MTLQNCSGHNIIQSLAIDSVKGGGGGRGNVTMTPISLPKPSTKTDISHDMTM